MLNHDTLENLRLAYEELLEVTDDFSLPDLQGDKTEFYERILREALESINFVINDYEADLYRMEHPDKDDGDFNFHGLNRLGAIKKTKKEINKLAKSLDFDVNSFKHAFITQDNGFNVKDVNAWDNVLLHEIDDLIGVTSRPEWELNDPKAFYTACFTDGLKLGAFLKDYEPQRHAPRLNRESYTIAFNALNYKTEQLKNTVRLLGDLLSVSEDSKNQAPSETLKIVK